MHGFKKQKTDRSKKRKFGRSDKFNDEREECEVKSSRREWASWDDDDDEVDLGCRIRHDDRRRR